MSDEKLMGLSFAELVDKIQEDAQFSRDFEALVLAVTVHPNKLNSPAGRELLSHFASTEEELAQLTAAQDTLDDVLANNRMGTVATTHTGTYTTGSVTCTPAELRNIKDGFVPPRPEKDDAEYGG